ncbi:MAG: ABC transporter permease [Aquificaceae bacterium]|nr:MAG: ABC transporter permease [Aquificaceae bacterium]
MLIYLLRRILLMIPTLLGITIVVFTVMATAPGGITADSLVNGTDMKPEQKQALRDYYNKRYGLDDPLPLQYLRWLNNVSPIGFTFNDKREIKGFSFTKGSDLGESFNYGRSVADLIAERLPITLLLNVITIPLIYIIAIIIGMNAARDRGGRFDVTSNVIMLALWSIPSMLAGVLMIGFFSSIQHWQWFPTNGLSSREALTMPFLPHWSSLLDVLKLFVLMILGAVFSFWLSQWRNLLGRIAIAAVLGIAMGAWMAFSHADFVLFNWIVLPLLGAITLALLAWTEVATFRVGGLMMIGAGLGLTLGVQLATGDFVRGFLLDRSWHLVLPIIALSYGGFAALAKIMRTSILENLNADYARTARAKGVAEEDVLWKHVFRNSLLPLITILAGLLPSLLGGSVIIEQIFSIDGMGKLVIEATMARDREVVLSITLIAGLLTLVGYLISDFLYTLVDPRIQYD